MEVTNKYNRQILVGIVEDNIDPKRQGRIKVRVQGFFEKIPNEHIPWASPYKNTNGKTFDVPAVGKIVNVIFENNIYNPYYINTDKYNINLQDKLESLSDDDYTSFISLLFDHKTRIYSDSESLTLDYLVNKMTIKDQSINLELKDNGGKVNLGTESADQSAVLGDHFIMDWFLEFIKILAKPTSLVGNMSAPILRPELDVHVQKFLTNPQKFISSNVFIVDNSKVDDLERDSITSEVEHDDTTFATPDDTSNENSFGSNVEQTPYTSDDSKAKIASNQSNNKELITNSSPSGSNINSDSISDSTSPNDSYTKPKVSKSSASNNSKYTVDNRDREDILNSSKVEEDRKSVDKTQFTNPNYGNYKKY